MLTNLKVIEELELRLYQQKILNLDLARDIDSVL